MLGPNTLFFCNIESNPQKVDNLDSITFLIDMTSIFEWYVVWCDFKNNYQKDMCSKKIGLYAQNMITILGSIVNINEGTYMII